MTCAFLMNSVLYWQHAWRCSILRCFKIWNFLKPLNKICQSRKLCTGPVCPILKITFHPIWRIHDLIHSRDIKPLLKEKKVSRFCSGSIFHEVFWKLCKISELFYGISMFLFSMWMIIPCVHFYWFPYGSYPERRCCVTNIIKNQIAELRENYVLANILLFPATNAAAKGNCNG